VVDKFKSLFNQPDWEFIRKQHDIVYFDFYASMLLNSGVADFIEKIKNKIQNSNQVVVLYGCGHPIGDDIFHSINEVAANIKNPIILCTGLLGNIDATALHFSVFNQCYFEYEAAEIWIKHNIVIDNQPRSNRFLSMSSKDYQQRKFILSKIIQEDLLGSGYVSYVQDNFAPMPMNYYTAEQIVDITTQTDVINSYLPIKLDSHMNWRRNTDYMINSYVNMITDTFYELSNGTFISEKVFNAIAHGQMFFMLAPPGTLQYLRDQGYQTFGNYVDETYDTISNHYLRLLAVTKSFIDFVKQPTEVIHQVFSECLDIRQHNRATLFQNGNTFHPNIIKCIEQAKHEKI